MLPRLFTQRQELLADIRNNFSKMKLYHVVSSKIIIASKLTIKIHIFFI